MQFMFQIWETGKLWMWLISEVSVFWQQVMPFLEQFDTSQTFLTCCFLIILFTTVIKTSPSGVIYSNSIELMHASKQTFSGFFSHEADEEFSLQPMKEFSSTSLNLQSFGSTIHFTSTH